MDYQTLIEKAQEVQDQRFLEGDVNGFFEAGEEIRKYEKMLKSNNQKEN